MSMVRSVVGGVDTHADWHVAAAVDGNGGLLGIESFPVDEAGFEELLGWLVGFGPVSLVGVEGTGSWGVGLARFLAGADVEVVEVDRPNRQARRKVGKSDPTDAVAASCIVGASVGDPEGTERPGRTDAGPAGGASIRRSATNPTLNQLRHLVFAAPELRL